MALIKASVPITRVDNDCNAYSTWDKSFGPGLPNTMTCPLRYHAKCEAEVGPGRGVVLVGSDQRLVVAHFTVRFTDFYPSWDVVHDNCQFWAKANAYAVAASNGTFHLEPDGFSCNQANVRP